MIKGRSAQQSLRLQECFHGLQSGKVDFLCRQSDFGIYKYKVDKNNYSKRIIDRILPKRMAVVPVSVPYLLQYNGCSGKKEGILK